MQATWFSTQPTQNASEYMGAGALARAGMAKAQDAEYDIDQKRKLQQVFSKNMDSLGNLSELDFYKAVSSEGLDPQHAAMAMEWRKQQITANEAEIQHRANSSMYGADTKAVGRNQATFGAPKPIAIPGTAQQQPQQDIFGGTTPREPANNIPKTKQSSKNPIVAVAPPPPAPETQQAKDSGVTTPAATAIAKVTGGGIQGWFDAARAKSIADNQARSIVEKTPMQKWLDSITARNEFTPKDYVDELKAGWEKAGAPVYGAKAKLAQFLGMSVPGQEQQQNVGIPMAQQVAPENQVNITAAPTEPSKAEEGKLPLPEVPEAPQAPQAPVEEPVASPAQPQPPTTYTPEDRRSAVQRYADSITDPTGMSNMPGQGVAGNGSRKYFQLDPNVSQVTKQAFATNLARNGALNIAPGKEASIADINAALVKQQDADYEAIGLPPGPQTNKEGKFDPVATRNALREYYNKFPAIYQKWVSTGGKEYADQLEQRIKTDANTRATLQFNNDVKAKQAGFDGMNQLVANTTKFGNAAGLGGTLDPTTFPTFEDAAKFMDQASAFIKIPDTMPDNPLEATTVVKSIIQSEGLSPTEGVMALFTMLGINDPTSRFLISQAQGGKIGGTDLVKAAAPAIIEQIFHSDKINGDLRKVKEHMLFKTQWEAHRGTGKMPKLGEFDQGAEKTLPVPAVEPPAKDDKGGDKGGASDKKQPAKARGKGASRPLAGRKF